MRAKTIAIMSMIVAVTVSVAGCASDSDSVTQQQNILTLDNTTELVVSSFYSSGDNYSITPGQPWGGVSGTPAAGNYQIIALAGRSKSSGPANWFVSQLSGGAAVFTGASGDAGPTPSELNFAFSGPLTIGFTTYNVVIGQGSDGAGANNWWLGGPGFTTGSCKKPNGLVERGVLTNDGQYLISATGLDDASMGIYPSNCLTDSELG